MNRYHIIFLSAFAIFIFFLTPNINTGDGGELATASFFLGAAHPSSYPLYLMLGKSLTFLPFGNIAFRVAIVSAIFSSLSLILIFRLVSELTRNIAAALFTVSSLLVSYSYFTQSTVAKFYALNLFLVMVLFLLWGTRINADRSEPESRLSGENLIYLTMFITGLITANHHTGILVLGPVALAWAATREKINLKMVFPGIVLFISGFLVNSYLFIRGRHDNFFNAVRVDNLQDFYQVLTRQLYNQSGTISVAANSFNNLAAFRHGFENFVSVLTSNFTIFSSLLFIAGSFFLLRKNYKFFVFAFIALLLYGPFLAKLTLGSATVSETEYYIGAHQYFLPAIALFATFMGAGFNQIFLWLESARLHLVPRIMPVLAVFPLVFLLSRATDSNFRTNFVPYQIAKDTYSILPADSVMLTFGDNPTYHGWYLKLVGRYREDVCQLASGEQSRIRWTFQGCNRKIYENVFPEIYSQRFKQMVPLMLRGRFYGTDPVKTGSAYESYLDSGVFSIDYLYYPQKRYLDDAAGAKAYINNFLLDRPAISDKLIDDNACLTHLTDDLFTRQLCFRYVIHLTNMARLYSGSSYKRTGKTVQVNVRDMKTGYLQPLYTVDVTEANRSYLERSTVIQQFNNWKIFYLRQNE